MGQLIVESMPEADLAREPPLQGPEEILESPLAAAEDDEAEIAAGENAGDRVEEQLRMPFCAASRDTIPITGTCGSNDNPIPSTNACLSFSLGARSWLEK